tara:strand:+ start:437 stop:832 length:396 start_codon:yes stop_codon:yes gene_type:complete
MNPVIALSNQNKRIRRVKSFKEYTNTKEEKYFYPTSLDNMEDFYAVEILDLVILLPTDLKQSYKSIERAVARQIKKKMDSGSIDVKDYGVTYLFDPKTQEIYKSPYDINLRNTELRKRIRKDKLDHSLNNV